MCKEIQVVWKNNIFFYSNLIFRNNIKKDACHLKLKLGDDIAWFKTNGNNIYLLGCTAHFLKISKSFIITFD